MKKYWKQIITILSLFLLMGCAASSETKKSDASTKSSINTQLSGVEDPIQLYFERLDRNIKNYLKEDIKKDILDDVDIDNIWFNSIPYYTPTEKEMEAIIDAYWERYIKDWDDYTISLKADYVTEIMIEINYRWEEPDMTLLNQKIEDRENELKKTLNGDHAKMFQMIAQEIPDIIRNMPKSETTAREPEYYSRILNEVASENKEDANSIDDVNLEFLYRPLSQLYP
ncbi:hypothetical protein [Streptococcus suis]